jgi:hypothetical protein
MRFDRHLMLLAATTLLGGGCVVFDEGLYKKLEPKGGERDGAVDGDGDGDHDGSDNPDGNPDAGMDAGGEPDDAGGNAPEDAGPPRLVDECTAPDIFTLKTSLLNAKNEVSFVTTTANFNDQISENACFDYELPGSEGFMAIEMVASERWHFHISPRNKASMGQAVQNPVVYMRKQCGDNRGCNEGTYLDLCGDNGEEHFTFEATSSGTWHFVLDDRNDARGEYLITAVKPECGNGVDEHNESCDTPMENNCSRDCRLELTTNNKGEEEPNDDWTMANIMAQVATNQTQSITGSLGGGVCDRDMFAFQVPEGGGDVAVVLKTVAQVECPEDLGTKTPIRLELIGSDARTVLGEGTTTPGAGACPAIGPSHAFAQNLEAGLYYVRMFGDETKDTFAYQLTVTVSD